MDKLLKNKKACIAILVVCILVLVGVIIGIAVKGDKDETEIGKGGSEEIIVHESDEDTVEEKAEGGLTESDSEDGPVLNENNMIDFNGSDAKKEDNQTDDGKTDSGSGGDKSDDSESAGNNNAGDESGDGDGNDSEEDEESKDTGAWGAFY